MYAMPPESILGRFDQINSLFNVFGLLHITMLQIGPLLYKYLGFFLMFTSGLLLDKICTRTLSVENRLNLTQNFHLKLTHPVTA